MRNIKSFSLGSAIAAISVFPGTVLAQSSSSTSQSGLMNRLNNVAGQSGFETSGATTVPVIIGTVINVALSFLGAIFLGLMIYAGYKWMTAAGSEQDIEKAKGTIKQAIIGLIVVLSSWSIWTFIFKAFILGA